MNVTETRGIKEPDADSALEAEWWCSVKAGRGQNQVSVWEQANNSKTTRAQTKSKTTNQNTEDREHDGTQSNTTKHTD